MADRSFTGERRDLWLVTEEFEVVKVQAERVVVTAPPLYHPVDARKPPFPPTIYDEWFVPHDGNFGYERVGTYYVFDTDPIFESELAANQALSRRASEEMDKARKWTTIHFKSTRRIKELLEPTTE